MTSGADPLATAKPSMTNTLHADGSLTGKCIMNWNTSPAPGVYEKSGLKLFVSAYNLKCGRVLNNGDTCHDWVPQMNPSYIIVSTGMVSS